MGDPRSTRPGPSRIDLEIAVLWPKKLIRRIRMPRICEFFGIVIYMYYNDHNPAHFHAEYAESEASFTIDTLETLEGELPRRPRAFVIEWASLHREELRANWERARQGLPLHIIEPLEWLKGV